MSEKYFDAQTDSNGHEYVDLGLPDGTLWATCNIGATTPEECGNYYAWGETEPKDNYEVDTYKYANKNLFELTKYCILKESGYNGSTHCSYEGVCHPLPQLAVAGSSLPCNSVKLSVKPLLP